MLARSFPPTQRHPAEGRASAVALGNPGEDVLCVAAEVQNVPIARSGTGSDHRPSRVPQPFDERSSFSLRESPRSRHEGQRAPPPPQQRDELFAQRLIVISRLLCFFVSACLGCSRGFPDYPREALLARKPKRECCAVFRNHRIPNSSHICRESVARPRPFRPHEGPPILHNI